MRKSGKRGIARAPVKGRKRGPNGKCEGERRRTHREVAAPLQEKVEAAGILKEVRRRQYYLKPSTQKKQKRAAAAKRRRRSAKRARRD